MNDTSSSLQSNANQAVANMTDVNDNQNDNSPNGDQNDSPLLSLFDVLVDEYEHQVRTHGLKSLYPDHAENPANNNRKLKLAEKMSEEAEDLSQNPARREEAEKRRIQAERMRKEAIDDRLEWAKEMRKAAKKKRVEVEEKYVPLKDEKESARRINEELVKDFYGRLHRSGEKRAALCFSGGGIRSATFGLGVLQGLARHVNLDNFHYLSTVSGGGYLGSWFSAWAHRRGMKEVQSGLEGNHDDKSPLSPEPEPILHLRRYSNYMSPKLGLLSADTWTLVGIYLRNLLLNWLVLIPLIAAALSLPRLWMSALAWDNPDWYVVNGVLLLGFISGGISIAYIIINRPSLADLTQRGWFPELSQKLRSERWFLILGLGGMVVTAIGSALYWSWIHIPVESPLWRSRFSFEPRKYFDQQTPWAFMAFGVALHLLGYAVSQLFARQIFRWKRYSWGIHDITNSAVTGVLSGLCLWGIARAFQHPILIQLGKPLNAALYACFAPPLFMSTLLIAGTVFIGLASYYTTDADREWVARAGGWILIAITVWIAVNGLVIFGPVGLAWLWGKSPELLTSTGIGAGLITLLGGRSGTTSAKKTEEEKTKKPDLARKLLELALPFTAVIFALIFVATLSLATTALTEWIYNKFTHGGLVTYLPNIFSWFNVNLDPIPNVSLGQRHLHVLYQTPNRLAFFLLPIFAFVGMLMGIFVNVNKFSLHSAYRDRLVRAYLGASRSANERRPNPFTGLDEQDNLQMHDLIRPVFSEDNFDNFDELVKGIAHPETPRDRFIWSCLSQRTRDLLKKYNDMRDAQLSPDAQQMIEDEARRDLTDNFNRIIHGPPLHKDQAFKKVIRNDLRKAKEALNQGQKYSDAGTTLIKKQPEIPLLGARWLPRLIWPRVPVERLRINTLLLEAAFDGLIKRIPEELYEARPLHVINMALNLVKGEELAWQDRKAQSFTVSPLHAGSLFDVGYRSSKKYAISRKQSGAISLGTSMAISGAAANPNMGYHSSPVVTFLMTLFNVRLGWWLGNPGQAGEATHSNPGPELAPRALIAETLGWTNKNHSYVHLSDGGHFENLGLYEMVLRRCHLIVVSDGSQDKDFDFESLGNAMSKIRTDLGIGITFDSIPISPREERIPTFIKNHNGKGEEKKKYCAIGRIHYSDVDEGEPDEINGYLVYIKPAIYGIEPADVQNYARANPAFPHESTGDQMYSETQFESYRALGFHEVSNIAPELKEMFQKVYQKIPGKETPQELHD